MSGLFELGPTLTIPKQLVVGRGKVSCPLSLEKRRVMEVFRGEERFLCAVVLESLGEGEEGEGVNGEGVCRAAGAKQPGSLH